MQVTRKRCAVVAVIFFLSGALIGLIRRADMHQEKEAISVDFCFLARNPDLFNGRLIATSANLVASMHGALLLNPACPDLFANYKVNAGDSANEILIRHRSPYWSPLAIEFVGKAARPCGSPLSEIFGSTQIDKRTLLCINIIHLKSAK